MISFSIHEVRAGKSGASEDFEQMLALLVEATYEQQASLVFANPATGVSTCSSATCAAG
jgi:hypothetical protein